MDLSDYDIQEGDEVVIINPNSAYLGKIFKITTLGRGYTGEYYTVIYWDSEVRVWHREDIELVKNLTDLQKAIFGIKI